MSAVAVPGLLLAFLLGLALSRSITAPLAKITAVASAAAAGDLDARPLAAMANRGDEIGTLADTFANMTTQLKETLDGLHQSRAELEERVVARTGELKQSNEQLAAEVEERRRAEAMLTLRSQELLRSNSELEQFAYVASHDLQEPLRMVTSYMQLLERRYREKLDSDAREFIGFAVDGAKRMRVLIEDLLSYSRIATRGQPFRPTDCERVLEAVEGSLRVAIQESGARVTHGQLPTVVADPTQLQQLFQNLISNAIKFRRNVPPEVHVEAGSKDDSWCFSVRDNGIGIEPRFFDRIFVVFQRLHSRTAYPGTGIGLAICKKIVERHGGSIWVDSELGVGTTFHFTIPKKGALS
jgi:light-regulated signal transduction histidine kinase (bacteriophytochrome)/HAMP domain-containing protein